jgi:hypothetical protein
MPPAIPIWTYSIDSRGGIEKRLRIVHGHYDIAAARAQHIAPHAVFRAHTCMPLFNQDGLESIADVTINLVGFPARRLCLASLTARTTRPLRPAWIAGNDDVYPWSNKRHRKSDTSSVIPISNRDLMHATTTGTYQLLVSGFTS